MNTHPVWITGAGGLIGNYLVQTAARFAPEFLVRGLARADLDLEDFATVRAAFRKDSPEMVIHCAALANTPAATAMFLILLIMIHWMFSERFA